VSSHPCTPQGELTVSPSIPCGGGGSPPVDVPVPATLALVIVGAGILAYFKRKK